MRNLTEFSYEELIEVLAKNPKLSDLVYESYCDSEQYYISDLLADWEGYCAYIEIGQMYKSTICVRQYNYKDFLNGVLTTINDFGFIWEQKALIERLLSRIDIFDMCLTGYCDMSGYRWNMLEKWFDTGINTICDAIIAYIDSIYDIDREGLADWLSQDIDVNDFCWNDIDIDDNGIAYRTITKCLA